MGNALELFVLIQRPISDSIKLKALTDTAKGCDFIHSHDIVHFDIKSANILYKTDVHDNYTFKISDFGVRIYN